MVLQLFIKSAVVCYFERNQIRLGAHTCRGPARIHTGSTFFIFINDIVKDISSSIRLFADDTSLYIMVENPQIAARLLNLDLDIISNWALDWLVDFNARKTMSLLLSTKLVLLVHIQIFMNNTVTSESSRHKHLGISFSSTCSWTEHI